MRAAVISMAEIIMLITNSRIENPFCRDGLFCNLKLTIQNILKKLISLVIPDLIPNPEIKK